MRRVKIYTWQIRWENWWLGFGV